MKVKDYIKALETLPDHLKETEVLVEWTPESPRRTRFGPADHFHVFFVDSNVVSIMQDALKRYLSALSAKRH